MLTVTPPAVIAVERLDDHRITNAFGRPDRLVHAVDQLLPRHRQTEIGKDRVAKVLVRGNFDSDMRGPRRQRRLDPLLILALADLDQAGVVQPVDRNVAGLRRAHQFHGRGSERTPFAVAKKILDAFAKVRNLVVGAGDGREHVAGNLAGLDTDVLIVIAVKHFDAIWIVRQFRPRQRAVNAGSMLKRQGQPCDQITDTKPLVGA